jgi:hypothetical protein
MCTGQRKIGQIVIEGSRAPGTGIMTDCAVMVKLIRDMVWIDSTDIVSLVTEITFLGCTGIHGTVTCITWYMCVRSGQRETGTMFVRRFFPTHGIRKMAVFTGDIESGLHMSRIGRLLISLQVAPLTIKGRLHKLPALVFKMARFTVE